MFFLKFEIKKFQGKRVELTDIQMITLILRMMMGQLYTLHWITASQYPELWLEVSIAVFSSVICVNICHQSDKIPTLWEEE